MKRILFISLCVIALFSCTQEETDIVAGNLKGKIKSMVVNNYSVSDSFFDLGKKMLLNTAEVDYNSAGNKSEEEFRDNRGMVLSTLKYEYNTNNRLIRIVEYSKTMEILSEKTYVYNEKDELSSLEHTSKGNTITKTIYGYNYQGQVTEVKEFFDSKMEGFKSWIKYDYDSKTDNIYKKNICDDKGAILSSHVYVYDKNDRLIEDTYFDKGKFTRKVTYKYDKRDNHIEVIFYNDRGVMNYLVNYEYEYDNRNNWVSKVERNNTFARTLVERVILY